MDYKIEKECTPCVICNNTGWKLLTHCTCSDDEFQEKNAKTLLKYWSELFTPKQVRLLIKEGNIWKQNK